MLALNKTQVGDLGPLGPLVAFFGKGVPWLSFNLLGLDLDHMMLEMLELEPG